MHIYLDPLDFVDNLHYNVLHKQKERMKSITTSIRIKPQLRQELQSLSAQLSHGMNWIIEQAIVEYLQRHHKNLRVTEALKDIAFLQGTTDDQAYWDNAYDDSDWEA